MLRMPDMISAADTYSRQIPDTTGRRIPPISAHANVRYENFILSPFSYVLRVSMSAVITPDGNVCHRPGGITSLLFLYI